MRDALSNVFCEDEATHAVDRILAAAFFRKRPMQAGVSATVVLLAERGARREGVTDTSFLQGGKRR